MSSWLGDYRWTDTDVREGGDELKDLALSWLVRYEGDFEPLLRIKEYYTTHAGLTVVQQRTILNCMRGDNEGFAALKSYTDFNASTPMTEVRDAYPKRERRRPKHLRVVPEPVRKYPYELKHTWKKRYLISASKNAKVGHITRPKHSTLKYYPSQEGVEGSSPYQAWVSTWCSFHIVSNFGRTHGSNRYSGGFAGFMVDDPEDYGYRLCMSCICNFAERGPE